MHDQYFKDTCINRIRHIINKFNLNLQLISYTETSALVKFDLWSTGRLSDVKRLEDEFQNVLGKKTVVGYGGGLVNIILPKPNFDFLPLKEILDSPFFDDCPGLLKIALGENVDGLKVVGTLERWVHLLIAGETGGGKSVCLHTIIASLINCNSPAELKFVLIDLKRVEFPVYDSLDYLRLPIAYNLKDSLRALNWLVGEMENRFVLFQESKCRNISSYNKNNTPLPFIVIIIDEFANLTLNSKDSEKQIIKLAQMSRAAGIHLILSTQKPSADVVTPLIKANIPTRIAFTVPGYRDSMVILDEPGAEKLNKRGDMILKDDDGIERIQGAYISEEEIEEMISGLTSGCGYEIIDTSGEVLQLEYKEVDHEYKYFYRAAKYCIESNKCNHWQIKKFLHKGDTIADKVIEYMQQEKIINDDKVGNDFKILINLEDFNDKYKEA